MDQVKSNFYENQILEAIETVATGVVSKLQFDQTILCTITNDSKRKNGEYEVSDGSSTFKAFSSDTNYKKDMAVYVLVPQGDFERQKTIVGKYVDDTASAINYIPASQSIIEVVKPVMSQTEYGLLANGIEKSINIVENINWFNTNIYDCVSLKAKFKTDLSKYNIIDGDYGLILTLGRCESVVEDKTPKLVFSKSKFYKFSCKDMFGDPYNYNTYFDQDIVFNLSEDFSNIKINYYRLDFYQNGKFKDLSGNDIPCKDDINNINFNNNLFVKDIQMAFGYSTVNIKEEGIQIYTPDNLKYISRLPAKNIVLKWFQKNEVGNNTAYGVIDTLDEAEGNNYSVYWYRYRIGAAEDDLAGAFWELLDAGAYNDNIVYSYEIVKDPDGKYTYKDSELILANSDTKKEDKYKMEIKINPDPTAGRYEGETSTDDPYNIQFAPDRLLNREKIKAILVKHEFEETQKIDKDDSDIVYITFEYSPKIYESNEIVFENANPASLSLAAVDLIKNMRLKCTDGSNGVYKLYNAVDNEIINNENTKVRTLNVLFDTYSSKDIPSTAEQCKITWKIPKSNSMINPVDFTINTNLNKPLEEKNEEEEKIPTLGNISENVSWSDENDNYYICSYNWNSNIAGFDDVHKDAKLSMNYSIDKFYSQSYSNNTIICEIEKYGKTYAKEIEFIFGETGTNGTGYTVSLKLEKEYDNEGKAVTATAVPCVTEEGNKVKVIASLFDEHGNDISKDRVFKWNWLNKVSGFKCDAVDNEEETAYCYIQHDGKTTIGECYGILSATVAGEWLNKNVQLTGYLPLGIRSKSSLMKTYKGTTKIIYNEQGSRPTYQKEHSLDIETTDWKVQVLNDNTWENFAPYFKEREDGDVGPWILVARDMYFSNLATEEQMVIHAYSDEDTITYSQSLLYDQNRFGNAMFNNWDGSLVVDNGDNKILAAIVGAGKKDNNNTFTGVVMGETTTDTGLFGYSQGIQTFGFNTNGTAFIGASGEGQIRFDGTHGTIQSATGNTELDLADGRIYLSNGTDGTANITIDSNNTYSGGYFSIKHLDSTNGDKTLIYIGDNNYYLQSKEFAYPSTKSITEEGKEPEEKYFPGTGVRFDLAAGKLIGYDFEMRAGQADNELIITSDLEEEPLKIGSKFKVNWDGTVTASDGNFTGEITAETGTIGGWTIVKNALYKGGTATNSDDDSDIEEFIANNDSIIIVPDGGITFSGLSTFTTKVYNKGTVNENTGELTGTNLGWQDSEVKMTDTEKIIFAIGKNFVVTQDGTLYANGANLSGYISSEELSENTAELLLQAAGFVKKETNDRAEEDNKLDGRIGVVNIRTDGAIRQIGEYEGKSIFIDSSLSDLTVEKGYYQNSTTFYQSKVIYDEDGDKIDVFKEYVIYYNKTDGKYYIKNTDPEVTEKLVEITNFDGLKTDIAIEGYLVTGTVNDIFYLTEKLVKDEDNTFDGQKNTIYIDIESAQAYFYDDKKDLNNKTIGYRLIDPETDQINIFMVNSKGLLTATNAVIGGQIYARSGYIGGWVIQHHSVDASGNRYGGITYGNIHPDNNGTLENSAWQIGDGCANLTPGNGLWIANSTLFGNDNNNNPIAKSCVLNVGKKFAVDKDGILYTSGAVLSGAIYAKEGTIGGWTIEENGIHNFSSFGTSIPATEKKSFLCPTGIELSNFQNIDSTETQKLSDVVFNIGTKFAIQHDGTIYAADGNFGGTINATEGEIAGWTIGQSPLSGSKDKAIYKQISSYLVGLQAASSSDYVTFFVKNNGVDKFYVKPTGEVLVTTLIGKDTSNTVTFRIKDDGALYVKNAFFNKVPEENEPDTGVGSTDYTEPTIQIIDGTMICTGRWTSDGVKHKGVNKAPIKIRGGYGFYPLICFRTGKWRQHNGSAWVDQDTNSENTTDDKYVNWILGMDGYSGGTSAQPTEYRIVLSCSGDYGNIYETSNPICKYYFKTDTLYDSAFYAEARSGLTVNLGTSSKPWNTIYGTTISGSDIVGTTISGSDIVGTTFKINSTSVMWISGVDNKLTTPSIRISNWPTGTPPTSIDQSGLSTAAIELMHGGAGYYSLMSCKNGAWCSLENRKLTTSTTNIFWGVGIDGTSYKFYTSTQNAVDPRYRFIISAGGDDSTHSNDQPRVSYVFMYQPYKADSPETNDNFSSLNRAYFYAKFREGNNAFSTKSSCLGHPSYKWDILYINSTDSKALMTETTSNTSDIRLKDIQNNISENQLLSIYNNLNPVAYKYKNLSADDNHSRTHIGFLAQEVEKIIEDVGLTSEDFAAVQIVNLDEPIPGCEDGKKYYLNYNEFHGLHVLKNQEQDKRILELEQKVQYLENKILELSGKGV